MIYNTIYILYIYMYIYICLFLIIRKGKGWLNPLAGHWIDLEEKQFDLLQPQQCPGTLAVQKMPEKLQAGDVDSRILYLLLLQFTDCFFSLFFDIFTDETSTRSFMIQVCVG